MNDKNSWKAGYEMLEYMRDIAPKLVVNINVADISPSFIDKTINELNREISYLLKYRNPDNINIVQAAIECKLVDIEMLIPYIRKCIQYKFGKRKSLLRKIEKLNEKI